MKRFFHSAVVRWTVAVLITGIMLVILISNIDMVSALSVFRSVAPTYIAAALVLHIAVYLVRTLRLKLILQGQPVPFRTLFGIHALHNMYNHLLPAGTGEISLPILLRKYGKKSLSAGSVLVVMVRIGDVLAQLLFFLVALTLGYRYVRTGLQDIAARSWMVALILIVIGIAGSLIAIRLLTRSPAGTGNGLIKKIRIAFTAVSDQHEPFRFYLLVALLTLIANFLLISVFYMIIAGLGMEVRLIALMIASTILLPVYLLPLRGIAGFGTLEGGWALGLWVIGIDKTTGITTGFTIHMLSLVFVMLAAVAGFVILSGRERGEAGV